MCAEIPPATGGMSIAPLGIIAGSGQLPQQLIEACNASQRPFFVICFEETETVPFDGVPHARVRLGAVGEAIGYLKSAGVQDIVLAGGIRRPSLGSLRPDAAGARLLTRLSTKFFAGDDAVLKTVMQFLEEEGFRVLGADTLLGGLLAAEGALGRIEPDAQALADMRLGMEAAKALGRFDIGQAVIVENGLVLAVEGAEGTDALINRCAGLKRTPRGGVLVKARKPQQDRRADLPSIGVQTVENAHAAGLAGIAVEAGASLLLERERTISAADTLGLFIVGMNDER